MGWLAAIIVLSIAPIFFGVQSLTWSAGEDFGWLGSVLFGLPSALIQVVVFIVFLDQTEEAAMTDAQVGTQRQVAGWLTLAAAVLAVLGAAKPLWE